MKSKDEELRRFNKDYIEFKEMFKGNDNKTYQVNPQHTPLDTYLSNISFDNLTEINVSNLNNGLNKNKYITLTTFSWPIYAGNGITTLAEDKSGGFLKLDIYVFGKKQNWEFAQINFPMGTLIKIKEPFFKQFMDGCYGIRIEQPQHFWFDPKPIKINKSNNELKVDNGNLLKSVKKKSESIIQLYKLSFFDQAQNNFIKLTETEDIFSKIAVLLGNLGSIQYINKDKDFGILLLYMAYFIDNKYENGYKKLKNCIIEYEDEEKIKEIDEIKANYYKYSNQNTKENSNKELRRFDFVNLKTDTQPNLMLFEYKYLFKILDYKKKNYVFIDKQFNELNNEAKEFMRNKDYKNAEEYFISALKICSDLGSYFFNLSKSLYYNGNVYDSIVSTMISIFFQNDYTKSLSHLLICLNHFNILYSKSSIFDREIHEYVCTLMNDYSESWQKLMETDTDLCALITQKIKLSKDFDIKYPLIKNLHNLINIDIVKNLNEQEKYSIDLLDKYGGGGQLNQFTKYGHGQKIPNLIDEYSSHRGYPSCSNKELIDCKLENTSYLIKSAYTNVYSLENSSLDQLRISMNYNKRYHSLFKSKLYLDRFRQSKMNTIIPHDEFKFQFAEEAHVFNYSNIGERPETFEGNHVYVSIGFMDLSVFINCNYKDSFANNNCVINFYGYDSDPFCIAKTLVLKELLINENVSEDVIFEVWYSPLWSRGTKYKFQKSVMKVLSELSIDDIQSNKKDFEKLKQILLKWLYTDLITLYEARIKWLQNRSKLQYLFDLKYLQDRLDFADYELGGTLIKNPVEGNICMFSYGDIDSDENILWNFPIRQIEKYNKIENKTNFKDYVLNYYRDKIKIFKKYICEDKIEINVRNKRIEIGENNTLESIKNLKPDIISYSNLQDYWGEIDFHIIAYKLSSLNTKHYTYSMNYVMFFKGSNILDFENVNYYELERKSYNYIKEKYKNTGLEILNLQNSNTYTIMNYTQYYLCAQNYKLYVDYFQSKSNYQFENFETIYYNYNPYSRACSSEIYMIFEYKK